MNHLVDPSFQGVNRVFVLSFENEDDSWSSWVSNVMIDGKNFFDQPINNDTKTYENITKIACLIILISKNYIK